MKKPSLKLDLHVHTCYSHDALITPKQLKAALKAKALDGAAITDHNTLKGYTRFLPSRNGFLLIPGVEIDTVNGHVLALNVTKPVASGLSVEETIERIHDLGGIAVASHPSGLKFGRVSGSLRGFDAVEIVNASAFPLFFSRWRNQKIADMYRLPGTAGSDAHCMFQVGSAYTMVEAEKDVDSVVNAILKGATMVFGKQIPWPDRFRCEALMLKKKLV